MSFEFFDKIYCINLPNSIDRWKQAQDQFEKVGIKNRVEQIWAEPPFDGLALSTLKYPKGELGVTLSQTKALVHALASSAKNVLIFEDDVTFEDNAIPLLHRAVNQLPPTWELLFLGGNPMERMIPYSPELLKISHFLCAHAYAVNRPAMLKLYNMIADKLTVLPYDGITSLLASYGNGYVVNPQICWTSDGQSVIRNAFRSYRDHIQQNWNRFKPQ